MDDGPLIDPRQTRIQKLVSQCVERQTQGLPVNADQLQRDHADLMPELAAELAAKRLTGLPHKDKAPAVRRNTDTIGFLVDPRQTQIQELVSECVERQTQGLPVDAEQLQRDHAHLMPELGEELAAKRLIGLARKAFERANRGDETVTHRSDESEDNGARIAVRCPHCSNSVVILADIPWSDITCVACGNVFSLVADENDAESAPVLKRIAHFELLERIGVGGFGTVWKARDTILDRPVALKLPRNGQLTEAEIDKFLREARAAAQLRHPGIVSVHEVGRTDETVYIVSDLVHGVSLSDWAVVHRPTPREVAELTAEIAESLTHAHQVGIVHRDLKPGNIMVDHAGKTHIMDFGLAKRDVGEVTVTLEGQVLGTPAYMSPEQAMGQAHNSEPSTDVYSLGVVLFELLTGELPFRGNANMLLNQVLHDEPPSPRRLNNHIPVDLETICLRCLEKEPAKRFESAGELAQELERFVNQEPILSRPIGPVGHAIRWTQRHRTIAALVAAVIALLIVGSSVSTFLWLRSVGFAAEAASSKQSELTSKQALSRTLGDTEVFFDAGASDLREPFDRNLAAAAAVWQRDPSLALALLEDPQRCPEAYRDFLWRYLHRHCIRPVQQLSFHDRLVAVHLSDIGDRLQFLTHEGTWGSFVKDSVGNWHESGPREEVQVSDTSAQLRHGRWRFIEDGRTLLGLSPDRRQLRSWSQAAATARGETSNVESSESVVELNSAAGVDAWDFELPLEANERVHQFSIATGRDLIALATTRLLASEDFSSAVVVVDRSAPSAARKRIELGVAAVRDIVIAPGGEAIYVCTDDDRVKRFLIDDETAVEPEVTVPGVRRLAVSHRQLLLAGEEFQMLDLGLDLEQRVKLTSSDESVRTIGASVVGDKFVSCTTAGKLQFWDLASHRDRDPTVQDELVTRVAYSHGEVQVAVVTAGYIRRFDAVSGEESQPIPEAGDVIDLHWAPDDSALAFVRGDGSVCWVGLSGPPTKHEVATQHSFTCLAFANADELLLGDVKGRLYRVAGARSIDKGTRPVRVYPHPIRDVTTAPLGKAYAVAAGKTVYFQREGAKPLELNGHGGNVVALGVSRNGNQLVSLGDNGQVFRWKTNPVLLEKQELTNEATGESIEITPDGKTVATIAGRQVQLWDAMSGLYRGAIDHSSKIRMFHFATQPVDGTSRLALVDEDGGSAVLFSGEMPRDETIYLGSVARQLICANQQPDQQPELLALTDSFQLVRVDLRDTRRRQVTWLPASAASLTSVDQGRSYWIGTSIGLESWQPHASGDELVRRIRTEFPGAKPLRVRGASQGELVAILARDGTCWSMVDATWEQVGTLNDQALDVVVSRDGRLIYVATSEHVVRYERMAGTWLETRRIELVRQSQRVELTLTATGAVAAVMEDRVVCWDDELTRKQVEVVVASPSHITAAFHTDQLATSTGREIQLWRLECEAGAWRLEPVGKPLDEHKGNVVAMCFRADDSQLLSSSEDRSIKIWPLANAETAASDRTLSGSLQQPAIGAGTERPATPSGFEQFEEKFRSGGFELPSPE